MITKTRTEETYKGFLGRTPNGERVFVTLRLGRYVSVTAEVYAPNRALTGDIMAGGQCKDYVRDVYTLASHLNDAEIDGLMAIWDRRHLGPVDGWTAERVRALGALLEGGDPDEAEDEVETLTEDEAQDQYDEWLDGIDGPVVIGNYSWPAGEVLRAMSADVYELGMREWAANEGIEIEA